MQCDVAEQYGLYMKITGAQRIDMFGAHVEDLPNIWEQLVTAGYESGLREGPPCCEELAAA